MDNRNDFLQITATLVSPKDLLDESNKTVVMFLPLSMIDKIESCCKNLKETMKSKKLNLKLEFLDCERTRYEAERLNNLFGKNDKEVYGVTYYMSTSLDRDFEKFTANLVATADDWTKKRIRQRENAGIHV